MLHQEVQAATQSGEDVEEVTELFKLAKLHLDEGLADKLDGRKAQYAAH